MRIAFLGKGGSGKTTMAALFTKYLLSKKQRVLSVDADVNVHFGAALGVTGCPRYLSENYRDIYLYLEGNNPALPASVCIPECGSMPPGRHSKLVTMSSADSFLHTYAVKDPSRDWWHMAIGTYHDVGDGGDCFHYKTNAYQLVLHHLNDSLEQFLVADTTAGIDNLSTSLSIGYDLCVLCVEPTKKSVSVLENFLALSSSLPVPCLVIANKIEDPADSKFVRRYVPASMSCVTFPFVQEILEQERGSNRNISIGLEGFEAGFEAIIDAARVSQQDSRAARTALLRELFKQRVESYWNSFHGADLGVLLEDSAVAN